MVRFRPSPATTFCAGINNEVVSHPCKEAQPALNGSLSDAQHPRWCHTSCKEAQQQAVLAHLSSRSDSMAFLSSYSSRSIPNSSIVLLTKVANTATEEGNPRSSLFFCKATHGPAGSESESEPLSVRLVRGASTKEEERQGQGQGQGQR